MQKRAYRYRFYPTDEQAHNLACTFGCVRFVYNYALNKRKRAYFDHHIKLSTKDLSAALTALKREEGTAWLKEVSSVPLQQALRHLDAAYTQGDHKGSPLLWTIGLRKVLRSIVGAIPCGRPASFTSILIYCLFCLMLLASCTGSTTTTTPTPAPTRTATLPSSTPTTTPTAAQTPTAGSTGATTPQHFRSHVLLRGAARPDDLVFDRQGNVLFSDFYNGTISRLNKDGTATVLLSGQAGPEGLIVLPDGTMIIAEQRTNRILSLAPGAQSPTLLRVLPGTPSTAACKDGVDGIALDPSTNTIIVPDSPTGDVYSLSLDGKTLTLLASGITRPVGATVDDHGNIYVADECGGAVWRITPGGATTRIGGFGMPDDVAFDPHGNLLVIDLEPSIHALIRMNLITGKRETLANQGFIEPQGLIVDKNDNIYVSDDYADIIVEYEPA